MSDPTHLLATAFFGARMVYEANDDDDQLSIQRWLWLNLGRDAGPRLYRVPLEETFVRPALTLRLVATNVVPSGTARQPSWNVEHQVVLMAYGRDRAETIDLSQRVLALVQEGGVRARPWSIPLYASAWGTELARKLRVLRPSLAMGLVATDDEGKWSRSLELRVRAPRLRPVHDAPTLGSVTINRG